MHNLPESANQRVVMRVTVFGRCYLRKPNRVRLWYRASQLHNATRLRFQTSVSFVVSRFTTPEVDMHFSTCHVVPRDSEFLLKKENTPEIDDTPPRERGSPDWETRKSEARVLRV